MSFLSLPDKLHPDWIQSCTHLTSIPPWIIIGSSLQAFSKLPETHPLQQEWLPLKHLQSWKYGFLRAVSGRSLLPPWSTSEGSVYARGEGRESGLLRFCYIAVVPTYMTGAKLDKSLRNYISLVDLTPAVVLNCLVTVSESNLLFCAPIGVQMWAVTTSSRGVREDLQLCHSKRAPRTSRLAVRRVLPACRERRSWCWNVRQCITKPIVSSADFFFPPSKTFSVKEAMSDMHSGISFFSGLRPHFEQHSSRMRILKNRDT